MRDLIEQVLFTAPGERVNRPDFGSGLLQLVFAPNSDELAAATQFLVQGALQQWLGDLIEVERGAASRARTRRCASTVQYVVRRDAASARRRSFARRRRSRDATSAATSAARDAVARASRR